ncbi:glycosyltransferase family 4 protein [Persicitalea jodogahamensis]|uniref:glycosyltransferase family 4 protein n=1 Tax=Persicitalea jodogahamensis TaxID=402147 RepID=UPI0035E4B725
MKLIVFDSHPVQYRVPLWESLAKKFGSDFTVIYASSCSVDGYLDSGFNKKISWDLPLLNGYSSIILHSDNGKPLSGWNSLTGKGINSILRSIKPDMIFLTGMNYRFDFTALILAFIWRIPVCLRCETQDEAVERSIVKSFFRTILYKTIYKRFSLIFYIGELNKQHYLKHGVSENMLFPANYFTIDRFKAFSNFDKEFLRNNLRENLNISLSDLVIGFSGKLISKKRPDILFDAIRYLPFEIQRKVHIYFIGSGEMEDELKSKAVEIQNLYGIRAHFAGFVNQSELPAHYLNLDILVLPSRKRGETWGLVVNEAMQAGCSVITSDAVGCNVDFKSWERFRVFNEGDAIDLASKITSLSFFERDYSWAYSRLKYYSLESSTDSIYSNILNYFAD